MFKSIIFKLRIINAEIVPYIADINEKETLEELSHKKYKFDIVSFRKIKKVCDIIMNMKKKSFTKSVRISWILYIIDILYFLIAAEFFSKYGTAGLLLMAGIGLFFMMGTLIFMFKNCRCPHCGKYIIYWSDGRCPFCQRPLD